MVECPHCGSLILAHTHPSSSTRTKARVGQRKRWTRGFRPDQPYNPLTGRLRCPGCTRTYGVGILLWPVSSAPTPPQQAPDQRATQEERERLRTYIYGVHAAEPSPDGHHNVAIEQACSCPVEWGGYDRACPVHGWAVFKAEQARDEARRAIQRRWPLRPDLTGEFREEPPEEKEDEDEGDDGEK